MPRDFPHDTARDFGDDTAILACEFRMLTIQKILAPNADLE
jgi:hypothetical protein